MFLCMGPPERLDHCRGRALRKAVDAPEKSDLPEMAAAIDNIP
jgi:hypothetical protein